MQVFPEVGESTGEDGNLIATSLQNRHQAVNALGDRQMFRNVLHDAYVKPLEQGNTACKTLLEVYFATHRTLGDGANLCADAIALGQFVNALCLYEGRVHIEADESAHTAEHVITLEREVDLHLL